MTGRSELEALFDFRAPEGFDVESIGRQEEEVDAGVGVGTDDQRADRDRFEVQAIRLRQKHVAIDDIAAAAAAFIHPMLGMVVLLCNDFDQEIYFFICHLPCRCF